MYGSITNDQHPMLSEREVTANLRAENARLRELVRELVANCTNDYERGCGSCGLYRLSDGACMADVMAAELGVEVTE